MVGELSRVYSTLKDKDNPTQLMLELGKLKSINVYFSGQIETPGINLIHPFSDIFSSIVQAGGIRQEGSLRQVQLIRNGNVISLPTETFYALAADPFNLDAVNRIFQIKRRPDRKALLLLVESIDQARMVTENIPPVFFDLAETFWPGPLTVILPANKKVPSRVTGGTGTVGIRLLDQNFTRQLIRKIQLPIIGTSANLSGYPPCSKADDVLAQLNGKIELLIDNGNTEASAPSTVIDLTSPSIRLLREGAISKEHLQKYLS